MTCVVDHDSGRLVWAAPGQDKATLASFFDALGPQRSAQITHVSADGAAWIASVVKEKAPNAVRCADPFYLGCRVMPTSNVFVLVRAVSEVVLSAYLRDCCGMRAGRLVRRIARMGCSGARSC